LFELKRKDPLYYGEIQFESNVNLHTVSLDPIDEPVRPDALRKRISRGNMKSSDERDQPTKRRLAKRADKAITVVVALNEELYGQTFEIRTMRDLNKYRYKRVCVELVKGQWNLAAPFLLSSTDVDETISSEEEM
jgi:hypothetical protein